MGGKYEELWNMQLNAVGAGPANGGEGEGEGGAEEKKTGGFGT